MIPGVCAWIFVVLRTKPKVSSSLVKVSLRVGSSPGSSISRTRGTVELYLPHLRRSRCSIAGSRSEEHTSELQSLAYLVCRLLLEKKKKMKPQQSLAHRHNLPSCCMT